MTIARFENLLERTMGLNAASIGTSAVARALDARMRARTVESEDAYWGLLLRSREELQHLIETVVVPETWFFRDQQAFPAMTAAAAQFRSKDMSRPLRLLSLPCSTGEEPYTMAMALLDAGLPPGGFRIDAIDISAASLARARAGVFGRNSFRGHNLAFRDRHFVPAERGFRIDDAVRGPVQFHQGNMLGEGFLADADAYDVIFCRNLLIYFDDLSRRVAAEAMYDAMAPGGFICLGHSESMSRICSLFKPRRFPDALVHQKPLEC